MQSKSTYFNYCQDSIIGVWVCVYLKVLSVVTLNGVFGFPRRAIRGVAVCHVQPQGRDPGLIFFYFAGALLYE